MGLSAATKVRRLAAERSRRRLHRRRVHAGHLAALRGRDQDEEAAAFVESIIERAKAQAETTESKKEVAPMPRTIFDRAIRKTTGGIAVLAVLAVLAGCGGGSSDHDLNAPVALAPTTATPGGIAVEASDHFAATEDFGLALREIDAVHAGFTAGLKPYPLTLRGVKIVGHGHDAEEMRARYAGDGVIEACIHPERRPVIFCLPRAYAEMARAQNPGIPESYIENGVRFARTWLGWLYPDVDSSEFVRD